MKGANLKFGKKYEFVYVFAESFKSLEWKDAT
jgi:hypothetical protein